MPFFWTNLKAWMQMMMPPTRTRPEEKSARSFIVSPGGTPSFGEFLRFGTIKCRCCTASVIMLLNFFFQVQTRNMAIYHAYGTVAHGELTRVSATNSKTLCPLDPPNI